MKPLKEPGHSRLFYFLVFGLSSLSTLWLWYFLREFSDPSGANGYFYLKQIETIASGLGFYFKDYSLAFFLPVLFMKLIGDSLLSFQLSICTVWFALISGCGLLVRNILQPIKSWSQIILALGASTALVCTTQLYEFNLTFFKNAFALNLIIWGFVFFYSRISQIRRLSLAGLLFLAALLSHKSMLLILALTGFAWLVQKISFKRLALLALGFGALLGLFLWQFEKASAYLKVLFHFFTGPSQWWRWFERIHSTNSEMQLCLILFAVTFVVYIFLRRRIPQSQRLFADTAATVLFVALHPFQLPGPNGPSYRLILMAPAFGIPLLAVCLAQLHSKFSLNAIPLLAFAIQPFLGTKFLDDVFTPWSAMREDVLQIKEFVNPEDHLTSHHGFEFFIDYTTGIRSRSFLSDHPEKRDFRVAYIDESWLRDPDAQRAIRAHALLEIGSEYILIPEADWQELVKTYHIPFHWKNPSQHRPDYIYE